MTRLHLELLGSPKIILDGKPDHLKNRRALALLFLLCVDPGPHSREQLADLLWHNPSERQTTPQLSGRLSRALSAFQKWLEPTADRNNYSFVKTTKDHLEFNEDSDYFLDVSEFRKLTTPNRFHPSKNDAETLETAVKLYAGPFLDHFYLRNNREFDHWCHIRRAELHDRFTSALHALTLYYARLKAYDRAIETLEPHLSSFEDESLHVLLLLFYVTAGKLNLAAEYQENMRNRGLVITLEVDELCQAVASKRITPQTVQNALFNSLANPHLHLAGVASIVNETFDALGFRNWLSLAPATQSVLHDARRLAVQLKFEQIGTPHLLLALLADNSAAGVRTYLKQSSLSVNKLHSTIKHVLGQGSGSTTKPFRTPRYDYILDRARDIAIIDNKNHVLPQHLLYAILEDKKGLVVAVLECLSVDLSSLMDSLLSHDTND